MKYGVGAAKQWQPGGTYEPGIAFGLISAASVGDQTEGPELVVQVFC
jgi:hypothetical protein